MKLPNILRPAAARPAQDSAQAAGAATHLRRGRGVAEDRVQETHLPAPGHAEEDCGAPTTTQFISHILANQPLLNNCIVYLPIIKS